MKLRAEVAEKEATIYRESQAALEQVREEQQECLISHKEMSTLWGAKERQRLNADRMRLERARDHLRLDKEHTEAEKIELGKEITQQTEAFQSKKEELMLERVILQVRERLQLMYLVRSTNVELCFHAPYRDLHFCVVIRAKQRSHRLQGFS